MSGIFAIATIPVIDCEIVDEEKVAPVTKPRPRLPVVVAPRGESAPVAVGPSMIAEVPTSLGAFSAEDAMPYVIGAIGVIASGAILWWGSRPVRQNRRRSRSRR